MKKNQTVLASILILCVLLFSLISCATVEVPQGEITCVFQYGDGDIKETLTEADAAAVRAMFEGKRLYTDTPSCGFSETVALIVGDMTYAIANDGCGIICDMKNDKYFSLSDEENEMLRALLSAYGFVFPCV